MTPRWSIRNALRCARATRSTIAKAIVRHGRDRLLVRQLAAALRGSWATVRELERALARARHGARRKAAA